MKEPLQQIHKVIGHPGTGKTTRILDLIQDAACTYPIEEIGAISFTNASVEEMRKRLMETSGVSYREIRNVKTLHSHVFDLLGLKTDQIADKQIRRWNEDYPEYRLFDVSMKENDDVADDQTEESAANFRTMQIMRNRMIPIDQWPAPAREIYRAWSSWCHANDLVDFTGMLEKILLIRRSPSISVLFVDEAQDLTRLQLEIVLMWSQNIDLTTMVGDGNQAIFRFAGASPEVFRDLKHNDLQVLSQSYRVPPAVHRKAMDTLSQIRDREKSEYFPWEGRGEGEVFDTLEPDLSLPGSHMIISRCMWSVKKYQKWVEDQGRIYWNPYKAENLSWNPTNVGEFKAIKTYLNMAGNWKEPVTEMAMKNMIAHVIVKGNLLKGAKTSIEKMDASEEKTVDPWDLCLWGFSPDFTTLKKGLDEVFSLKTKAGEMALRASRGGNLSQAPIVVGTIHSVKGAEADHVWLDLRKTSRIKREERENEQTMCDELRVAYVGITRARETLGLLR